MDRPELEQVLGRLLGPGGPETGCAACFDRLDRYVELELAGADAEAAVPGLRAHLDGCSACCEEHESLRALAGGETAPDLLDGWAARLRARPGPSSLGENDQGRAR